MSKLKPAKNLRWKKIRVCATCKYCHIQKGDMECEREKGIDEDVGDMSHWIMVCDRWVKND